MLPSLSAEDKERAIHQVVLIESLVTRRFIVMEGNKITSSGLYFFLIISHQIRTFLRQPHLHRRTPPRACPRFECQLPPCSEALGGWPAFVWWARKQDALLPSPPRSERRRQILCDPFEGDLERSCSHCCS